MGAQMHYFTADIDGLPLVNLGYDQKTLITDLTITELVEKITDKYLPDFRGVSYYAQFSQSCGWKLGTKKEIRMHIWWWLDKKIELSVLKTYAKQVNETVGFSLLDTAIYQETQPIYIAAPIFPKGTVDHLPERSKLVKLEKASASLPDPLETTRKGMKGKKQSNTNQAAGDLTTLEQWRVFFGNLTARTPLHDNLLSFFFWALKEKCPESDLEQIKLALEKSPRMQQSPERWAEIVKGEWDNLLNWCKERLAETEEKASLPLPPGYSMRHGELHVETVGRDGIAAWIKVYSGFFRVVAVHKDIDTQAHSIEIQLENFYGLQNVIVPQESVSTKHSLIKTLSRLGANITDKNAALCVDYISACLDLQNRKNVETRKNTKRLGFHENTFVLPDRTLGEDETLKYRGSLPAETGKTEIYANTVRTIFNEWGDEAWVPAVALGLALASPFIGRFKLVRNPILALTGESGLGKSTLLKFAISAWATQMNRPFVIQGSQPNTTVGFSQNVNGLNGLPCLFDEINLAEAVKGNQVRWNNVAMSFANGQARIRGSKTNESEAQGGGKLTGVLLGSGEALPDCEFEGMYNRQLEINATQHPPLGLEKGSIGKKRADLLERTIDQGAGVFGGDFIQFVLDNWSAFSAEYEKFKSDWEWRFEAHTETICLVTTVLRFVGQMLNVNTARAIEVMIEKFSNLFCSYEKQENHPANRAMEKIRDMIANSTPATRNEGGQLVNLDYYKYGNMPFYWVTSEGDYAIPSTNELLEHHVGDVRQYFKKWVASGFMLPGKDKATQIVRSKIGPNNARCIVISHEFLESSISEPNVTPITPVESASEKRSVTGVTSENTTQNDRQKQGVTPVTPKMTSTEKPNVEDITIEASQPDDERQVLMELREIYRNNEIEKLPDVLGALEQTALPEKVWDQITKRLAAYEESSDSYEKSEFLCSIADWTQPGCTTNNI
jgi:hypothetical protein